MIKPGIRRVSVRISEDMYDRITSYVSQTRLYSGVPDYVTHCIRDTIICFEGYAIKTIARVQMDIERGIIKPDQGRLALQAYMGIHFPPEPVADRQRQVLLSLPVGVVEKIDEMVNIMARSRDRSFFIRFLMETSERDKIFDCRVSQIAAVEVAKYSQLKSELNTHKHAPPEHNP